MSDTIKLFRLELKNMLGINKILYSDKKYKALRIGGLVLLILWCLGAFGTLSYFYCMSVADPLYKSGNLYLILTVMMIFISILLLITNISRAATTLFAYKDYDMVMSLPVKTQSIISSKILTLYTVNIIFTLSFIIPSAIVYVSYASPKLIFYFMFAILLVFVPIIPLVGSTILSVLVSLISEKFKRKNLINLIFTFLLFGVILLLTLNGSFTNISDSLDILLPLTKNAYIFYPLSFLYEKALCEYNLLFALLFIVVSAIIFILFAVIISRKYKKINTILTTSKSLPKFKLTSSNMSSPFMSLYKKELKRYFSSSVYVFNTAFGLIMLFVVSVMSVFVFRDTITEILMSSAQGTGFPGKTIITAILNLFICLVISMSCSTCCSVSIEGKNYWILQSSPLRPKQIFTGKILVNLTFVLPLVCLSNIFFIVSIRPTFIDAILLFLLPIVFSLFISVLGILINLKLPKMEWSNETVVVKQSASVLVCMLLGILAVIICAGASAFLFLVGTLFQFSVQESVYLATVFTSVLFAFIIFILYRYILKHPKIRI